jgi:hypothetical protein
MAENGKVSIFNRGIRAYNLAGGISIPPGKTVEVPDELVQKYGLLGANGYRDLVDAATISPSQKKRVGELEAENKRLTDLVASLQPKAEAPAEEPKVEAPVTKPASSKRR